MFNVVERVKQAPVVTYTISSVDSRSLNSLYFLTFFIVTMETIINKLEGV